MNMDWQFIIHILLFIPQSLNNFWFNKAKKVKKLETHLIFGNLQIVFWSWEGRGIFRLLTFNLPRYEFDSGILCSGNSGNVCSFSGNVCSFVLPNVLPNVLPFIQVMYVRFGFHLFIDGAIGRIFDFILFIFCLMDLFFLNL